MTKNILQRYFNNTFFLNAPSVINTVIALATLPIALANLPIADYGKFQFVIALQTWFSAFTAGNITVASKRGIAQGLNGTFLYAFFARLKLLILAAILVLGIAFYLKILEHHIFSVLLTIVGFYLVFGYLVQLSFYGFLIAKKRFRNWCFWQILISSISMIGSAIVAVFTKNIIYFALLQLGSISILSCIAWLWIVKKENLIESYKNGEIDKECISYGLKLIPVDLASISAGKISYFIIGTYFGFVNLAIFSVANKLRDKCATIIKSARHLLYTDFAKIERQELIKIVNRHLVRIGVFGILLTLGFIGIGWLYIKFFLPEPFHRAGIYFAIWVLGLPAEALAIVLHTVLESHLRHKELTVIGIVPNFFKIVLILLFGYFYQIIGVCIALAISGWISFGFYYLLTIKRDLVTRITEKYFFLKKISNLKYGKP